MAWCLDIEKRSGLLPPVHARRPIWRNILQIVIDLPIAPAFRRDLRVKMWGTSSPTDKLTGDLGNVIEAAQIGVLRSDRLTARKSSPGNFGLLQHNPRQSGQRGLASIKGH